TTRKRTTEVKVQNTQLKALRCGLAVRRMLLYFSCLGQNTEYAIAERNLSMAKVDFAVGIGGENGQGIASTGDILARIFARRGLNLDAYNAYQSIIRGGHTFLTIRASDGPVRSMGDKVDVLIPLNQDSIDRHLRLLRSGSRVLYDGDKLKPGAAAGGVELCPMPMRAITRGNKLP